MLPYRDSRFTRIILVVFFLAVLAYAYFEGRGLLYGPSILIENRVMEVSEPLITIEGTARRIAAINMNGQPIPITEEGGFAEPYLLAPGYNKIVFEARDKYGKKTERVIEIIFTPAASPIDSTSSPQAGIAPQEP